MNIVKKCIGSVVWILLSAVTIKAQPVKNYLTTDPNTFFWYLLAVVLIIPALFFITSKYLSFVFELYKSEKTWSEKLNVASFKESLSHQDLDRLSKNKNKKCCGDCKKEHSCSKIKSAALVLIMLCLSTSSWAQTGKAGIKELFQQPGILITIVLIFIPIVLGIWYAISKSIHTLKTGTNEIKLKEAKRLADEIRSSEENLFNNSTPAESLKNERSKNPNNEIIQNISTKHETHFTALKKRSAKRPSLDADITKLILWYLGCAAFWLVAGTAIGEYVGIKFVAPDADHISWLSFGRLRPVHTNIVFWGWASLGMIGLGYYVVHIVSNTKIFNITWGWIALALTNLMVILGTLCLMAGINNGGGEFREYIWPVMALFAVALILTLLNFILTVAKRTTKEIYISNWYIISSIIFTIIVALTAYLPFWQDGVSETIVQGYFMHSGVGMWFTLFTLGLLYYFIPQQINKPIYAYSLGILAFWTQIIFYTIIGTHHFTFAPIPWWLQTVGIVGSAGMIIPVTAATINFVMTFKGQWAMVSKSYTLPFFFVAVIYYFVVSMQGTAEAFKYTNLIWHFTDFTVAHAHLGFYGIITFTIWGGIYVIVPRLTGKEPPQYLVGAHFWFAFIGLLFYTIPLSIGATMRGSMWMAGKPFIDSVVMMFDWWLWRAIGGSLMFVSHLIFFYNFYKMTNKQIPELDIKEETIKILEASHS